MGDALAPGAQIAGFTLERLLGEGGMGAVYLARDEALDRLVAVKVVARALAGDVRFRDRFLRESRAAARLEHPAIVSIYQAGEDNGRLFLAMRYVAGGSLADRLAAEPLAVDAAARAIGDVASALDAAHAAGLIHRDVKPGNVLLDGDRALLADFGLAGAALAPDSLGLGEAFSGTVGYAAPEQIEGDVLTGRTDQYGLACVAFECLTGHVPFRRESEVAAIYAHLSDPPPRASALVATLPPAVDAVLQCGLAKEPAKRFESCGVFASALSAALAQPAVDPAPRRRRRLLIGAAALVAVATGAAAVALTRSDDAAPVAARADALVSLDVASGDVRDVVPLGQRPTALVVAPDGIWVALAGAYQVVRVDRTTRQITQRVAVRGLVNGLAAADGAVWATLDTGREVLRIDPDSGQIGDRAPVANAPGAIAATDGSLWIASRLDGTVSQFDIATGKVSRTIPVGGGVSAVVAAFGSIWATSDSPGMVTRINPATGDVTDTIPVGHSPAALAAAGGSLWVANRSDRTVSQVDPTQNRVVGTVLVARSPGTLVASGNGVLVADDETGDLFKVAGTPPVATRVSRLPATVAAFGAQDGIALATTVGLPASHRGGTLRVAASNDWWPMDPAIFDGNLTSWIWDTLVRYRRVGGSAGFDLVPDLAEAIPKPGDNGRTYVFHVRRGIRYSNGMEVQPSDFIRALDRVLRGSFPLPYTPDPVAGDSGWATGLVGVQQCIDTPTSCDVSRAAVADDAAGTLTFHLEEPDPAFVRQLARTPSAPVPPGTPVDGVIDQFVPGTGPYVVTQSVRGKVFVERRNPYFHVWSADARPDGNPDEIRWLLSNNRAQQVALVESGKADAQLDTLLTPELDRLSRRYPSQLYVTPYGPTPFPGFTLDARRFPLSSREVRRAINLAIDRPAIVRDAAVPMVATCQTIRPGAVGFAPYCPYASGGLATGAPDVAKARALVRRAGATGATVTVALFPRIDDPDDFRWGIGQQQEALLDALRAIGLRPAVKTLPGDMQGFFDDRSQIRHACCHDGSEPTPAASDLGFITGECRREAVAAGAFCDGPTRMLTESASAEADPARRAEIWTELDRHLTDEAAWVPIGSGTNPVFLAKNVGNYGQQMQLLGSLWELLTIR